MNSTTRRIVTTLAGISFAASAVATTAPTAEAAAPSLRWTQAAWLDAEGNPYAFGITYVAPVSESRVDSVTCTLDGIAYPDCGVLTASTKKGTYFYKEFGLAADQPWTTHTFQVKVVAGGKTFVGQGVFDFSLR